MQPTNISWADFTWGVAHGCSHVSAGCSHCYAERISRQYGHTQEPWDNEHAAENVTMKPEKLDEPYSLAGGSPEDWVGSAFVAGAHPPRVFVNSMSDLFHSEISERFIQQVFGVMRNRPDVVFQVLTKRPGRAAHLPIQWPENVWLGTSVEDSRVSERIGMLADCDATVRFVSFEPLIGEVGDIDLSAIDWAIVGGESGPDHRSMENEWAVDLFEQCREQDVEFFFKQSSGLRPGTNPYLTLESETSGLREQREIQEYPPVHPVVQRARAAREKAAVTGDAR